MKFMLGGKEYKGVQIELDSKKVYHRNVKEHCRRCEVLLHDKPFKVEIDGYPYIVCIECFEKIKDVRSVKDLPPGDKTKLAKTRLYIRNKV